MYRLLFELLPYLPAHHEDQEQECQAYCHPHSEYGCALSSELVIVAFQVDDDNDPWQHICHISPDDLRELYAVSRIRLLDKPVPSPSVFMGTEHQVDHGTERQDIVGYKEIFQVHDRGTAAKGLQPGKKIKAQDAGDAQHDDDDNVDTHGFFPAESEQIHAKGDDVFKHAYDRRQSRKEQEQEKQRSPEPSGWHLGKDVGQGDEYESRSCSGFNSKGKACREYDQSCGERHKRIQKHNA